LDTLLACKTWHATAAAGNKVCDAEVFQETVLDSMVHHRIAHGSTACDTTASASKHGTGKHNNKSQHSRLASSSTVMQTAAWSGLFPAL